MALKKSELYSSLWSSCDELRGGMDASQNKDYVLVLLIIKYVSDKYAGQPYAPITICPKGFDDVQFAMLIGVKPSTLRNREQGRRKPTGPARALLRILEADTEQAILALHPKRG